jgi:hypothetical protein
MKTKTKILFMVFLAMSLPVIFSSCSKDDDDKENSSIVGTWKFKETTVGEVKTNNTANDSKISNLVTGWAKKDFETFTYTFVADGTFTLIDSHEAESGTYTFKDGTLKLIWGDPDDYDIYKASVVNGVLIFEKDYTEGCDDLELNELIELGISDPVNFQVSKAIAKISFSRQ